MPTGFTFWAKLGPMCFNTRSQYFSSRSSSSRTPSQSAAATAVIKAEKVTAAAVLPSRLMAWLRFLGSCSCTVSR